MNSAAQLQEIRDIRRKKWEEEKAAELAIGLNKEQTAADITQKVAETTSSSAFSTAASTVDRKRRLVSPTSSDDIEFVGVKKSMPAKKARVGIDDVMETKSLPRAQPVYSVSDLDA